MINEIITDDVKRLSTNTVRLQWRTKQVNQPVKIYLSDNLELSASSNKTLLHSTTDNTVELNIPNDKRYYFLIESAGQYYITAERVLPLEGAHNFRDIGGYPTNEGKRVKWGMLYRSDHLHNLTEHDKNYLRTVHFHSIIDYRNEKEYSKQPNQIWDSCVKTFNLIPDASSAELAAKASNDHDKIQALIALTQAKDSDTPIDGSGYIMQKQNRDFVLNPDTALVYRELIDIILNTKNMPMVQHCRGGKDRTGFGIAIIFAILDVKQESILADYAMTGKLRHARNMRRMAEYKKETNNPDVLAFLYSMMETRNSYLEAAFDEMKKQYGSIHGYLEHALKVTAIEKAAIKQRYLY